MIRDRDLLVAEAEQAGDTWVEDGLEYLQKMAQCRLQLSGLTEQAVAGRIVTLRRQRVTGKHIAMEVGVSPATVSRVLKRAGCRGERHRAGRADPALRAPEPRRDDPYRHQEA